jgi:hypothetical protein
VTDDQRILEKKALRNARTVFEVLERDDLLKRKRQTRALWIASVPIALVLVAIASPKGTEPLDDAAKQRRSCELDAYPETPRTRAALPDGRGGDGVQCESAMTFFKRRKTE